MELVVIINFKTYHQASGSSAVKLFKIMEEVCKDTGVKMIACPQAVDLRRVIMASNEVEVWSQHVDSHDRGRATGFFPAEIAKEVGVNGTLLNHSEHKISIGELGESVNKSKDTGLKTLIFADNVEEAQMASKFNPDYISYEPPELVGSADTSVARAKPEVIRDVVQALPETPIIVGAGVKDRKDVEVSLKLGAKGVAVASGVIKAEDQKKALLELARGF